MLDLLVQNTDVFILIKDQHRSLMKSIQVLKDVKGIPSFKQHHLIKLIELLRAHTVAEEQTIYSVLQNIEDVQLLTFEAIEEHAVVKILMDELEVFDLKNNKSQWSHEIEAKAKVLAEITEHHLEDEERILFKKARDHLTKEELIIIGAQFSHKFVEALNFKKNAIENIRSLENRDLTYL